MRRSWYTFRTAKGKEIAKLAADHAFVWSEAVRMAQRLANSASEDVYVGGAGMSKRLEPTYPFKNGGQKS